ncbi:MAG: phosphate:Na+ symporter [Flavobacteriales bacterium]|jgi:phosphate:Na+ symporter
MEFGIFEAVKLIGALGFFIYGMKVMSEGLQQVAGSKMRQVLKAMTTNRFTGVATGFLITAILQSSSATTVMTVSFVNAGLLSLIESAGVMMGANIGTTITGWLVSLIGFKLKIVNYALPIIAIGAPMLFSSKQNTKKWGETLIGFALLFLGLSELKDAVPDIKGNPEVLAFLNEFSDPGFFTRLMFVGVGTLLTVIVQSSSAAMTLTIVLTTQGLPIEIAAAMVLGENIGTTITAELASLVANVHAKRSARIHSLFNIIGVFWMIILMPYVIDLLNTVLPAPEGQDASKFALAAFHTTFNLLNVLLCIGFVKQLTNFAIKTVKSKGEIDEEFRLEHIERGVFSTPEISILEANKEVVKMGEVCYKLFGMVTTLKDETDKKAFNLLLKRIRKYEDITDRMEIEISDYLAKAAEGEMSESASIRVRSMLSILNDLERVGDICYQISIGLDRKREQKLFFTPENRESLNEIFVLVEKASVMMVENLKKPESEVSLEAAKSLEDDINQCRNTLREAHLVNLEKGEYKIQLGMIYHDIIHSMEKIGDHLINVTEAIKGLK